MHCPLHLQHHKIPSAKRLLIPVHLAILHPSVHPLQTIPERIFLLYCCRQDWNVTFFLRFLSVLQQMTWDGDFLDILFVSPQSAVFLLQIALPILPAQPFLKQYPSALPDERVAVVLLVILFSNPVSRKNVLSVCRFFLLAVLSVRAPVFLRLLPSAAAWLW